MDEVKRLIHEWTTEMRNRTFVERCQLAAAYLAAASIFVCFAVIWPWVVFGVVVAAAFVVLVGGVLIPQACKVIGKWAAPTGDDNVRR